MRRTPSLWYRPGRLSRIDRKLNDYSRRRGGVGHPYRWQRLWHVLSTHSPAPLYRPNLPLCGRCRRLGPLQGRGRVHRGRLSTRCMAAPNVVCSGPGASSSSEHLRTPLLQVTRIAEAQSNQRTVGRTFRLVLGQQGPTAGSKGGHRQQRGTSLIFAGHKKGGKGAFPVRSGLPPT